MKKHVLIATGLAVLSTSAYATKARMSALGQDAKYGSYYLADTRNVFRNAAEVNSMKNYVVMEWGAALATESSDGAGTGPAAEGGFFREAGAFAYGVYLGNDVDSQNAIRRQSSAGGYAASTIAMGNSGFQARDNELNVFFGGDMGVEWGANLMYAKGSTETTGSTKKEHSAMGLGLGMKMGDLAAHVNYGFSDESKFDGTNAGSKWEADPTMMIGAEYTMNAYTFFGEYSSKGAEFTANNTGTAKNETSQKMITIGAANKKEVSATSHLIMDLRYVNTKSEDKDGTTASNNKEVKSGKLPLTVAIETDATSWLTLRGSVSQAVLINNNETKQGTTTTKQTNANDTVVSAGATLNFGKLKVDGMIGNNGNAGSADAGKKGVLDTDRLLTQVAVHYWF